jgi:YHS domain-containing protein
MYKIILLLFVALSADKLVAQKSPVFAPAGIAIHGYDPVAFFTEKKPIKGNEQYSLVWKGVKWQFSSQDNLEKFKNNPEEFAPQYGGYCAYGMAEGHKAPTNPDTWTIENGKLYFNYNQKVKSRWVQQIPVYIEKANQFWPTIQDKE